MSNPIFQWPPQVSAGGSGTVTSVSLSAPAFLTVTGSPITTAGTLSLTLANESANTVFAGPASGGAAAPTFRLLVAADIPALPYLTSVLPSADLFVGNGSNVATAVALSGDATITNAGVLTIANLAVTNAKIANATIDLTTKVTGILPVANGGTSLATLTLNNVILGNGTSAPLFVAPGTSGNILTSNGTTWLSSAPATSGTVTSVSVVSANGLAGTVATATTTPAITLSTTVTGLLKGDGTAISAAVANTDYQTPISTFAAPANQFVTGFTAPNTFTAAQPAFSNLSGNITAAQMLALPSGDLYVGNGSNVPAAVALSGDATISNTGALTIANLAITNAKIANATIDLTTKVTGVLPVANGGTSASTLTLNNVILGNGTSAVQFVAPGTSGNVLTSNGTTWLSSAAVDTGITQLTGDVTAGPGSGSQAATIANNAVTNAKLAQMPTLTIKGNNTGGTANALDLTVAQVNTMLGDILANGTVAMTASLNLGTNKIINVVDPTSAQDAATKNYVDTVASGLNPKQAVYAATTGSNLVGTYSNGVAGVGATFTITATGAFTLDGTTPPVLSRILIKDQTSGFQNGIYDLTVAGTTGVSPILTRSLDYNTAVSMDAGDLIPVVNGTVNTLTSWLQTATITTVGTDALVFVEWTANPNSYLLKANNLSDVASASTSYKNISPLTTAGDLIYENATPTPARLPIGSTGNVLTVSGGLPVWAAPATSGTVTSVALTVPSFLSVAGSPITSSGTLAVTLATETANTVFAGPTSGGAATPAFRALVSADIPNNAANTSGTASNVTGVVALVNGGTGTAAASANAAFNALSPMTTAGDITYENATPVAARLAIGSTGNVLTVSGGLPVWAAPAAASTIATTTQSGNTNYFLTFVAANSSSNQVLDVGPATYNPSTGLLTATGFSGSGASLTTLNASNLSSGTVPVARATFSAQTLTETSNATTIDWSLGNTFTLTLNGNLNTVTFSNTTDGQVINVAITNTASNYTVTWGNSIKWSGGSQPVETVGAFTDVWTIMKVGSTFYGSAVQNFS